MSDVTEGDRDKAMDLVSLATHSQADMFGDMREAIAAALAEERAKARAPFERLEADLRLEASEQDAWDGNCIAAYEDIADRIRRAAEEQQ